MHLQLVNQLAAICGEENCNDYIIPQQNIQPGSKVATDLSVSNLAPLSNGTPVKTISRK